MIAKLAEEILVTGEAQVAVLEHGDVSLTGEVRNNGRWQHKKYRPADLDAWAAKNVVEGKVT